MRSGGRKSTGRKGSSVIGVCAGGRRRRAFEPCVNDCIILCGTVLTLSVRGGQRRKETQDLASGNVTYRDCPLGGDIHTRVNRTQVRVVTRTRLNLPTPPIQRPGVVTLQHPPVPPQSREATGDIDSEVTGISVEGILYEVKSFPNDTFFRKHVQWGLIILP